MKRIFQALFFTLTVVNSFAQINSDSSRHLVFKGVPIDGTLEEYVSKMKKIGFTHSATKDGVSILEGDFAAYKNCIVGVSTLKQKDLVSRISVRFPKLDTWSTLSSNYFELKEMLTEKYGKPSDCVEKFQSYSEPNDDNSRMHAIRFDLCKYYTTYETGKGTIRLSIEHEDVRRCFVNLTYFDKINSDTIKKQALDDL
jgi:hypothetical protein